MLYNVDGVPISTHSMLKTMGRCPRQTMYKYVDRLKPRHASRPLTLGKWMHFLLEAYYKGQDWRAVHKVLSAQYSELFDEEKEKLGDLPRICMQLMLSYLWHYKAEEWKVLDVEMLVECQWPNGDIYRGKVDMMIEDEYGIWFVDHKNNKSLPSGSFRLKDSQSGLYVWAGRRSGIDVRGFIWNYLRTAAPSTPTLLQDGSRLSKKLGDTTYFVYASTIKKLGLNPTQPDIAQKLAYLRDQRYEPGKVQTSRFFQRHTLERDDAMLRRIAAASYRTHKRMHSYPFAQRDAVERVPDRSCDYMCSYTRLCEIELYGGITTNILKQDFKVGDPLEYYSDEKILDS